MRFGQISGWNPLQAPFNGTHEVMASVQAETLSALVVVAWSGSATASDFVRRGSLHRTTGSVECFRVT